MSNSSNKASMRLSALGIIIIIVMSISAYQISGNNSAAEEPKETQAKVSVSIKQKKDLTLLAVKNSGDQSVFGVKIKIADGEIKFVKARGWDRDRVNENAVMVKTDDRPLLRSQSLMILLITDNQNSSLEWSVFDEKNQRISNGLLNSIPGTRTSETRAVYGMAEQGRWRLYSASLDGSERKLILDFDGKDFERLRPGDVVNVQLSPDGKYLFYHKIDSGELWLMRLNNQDEKLIASVGMNETLREFLWSPDSKRVVYQLYKIPEPCPACGKPAYNVGGPWYMYDLETEQTIRLETERQSFYAAIGWLNINKILFKDEPILGQSSIIYTYDINSNKVENLYELKEREELDGIVIHQNGQVLLSTREPHLGIECKLSLIDPDENVNLVLSTSHGICRSYYYYGENYWLSSTGQKLIYGKGAGPPPEMTTTDEFGRRIDKFGRHMINSVYSLELNTKRETIIFKGEVDKSSFIMGGWSEPNNALAIIEQYPISEKELGYKLFISKADGSGPIVIATSKYEISFYGWV